MTAIIEVFGTLFNSPYIFGMAGMAISIIALLLAVARSMTNNQDEWPLILGSIGWLIALLSTGAVFGGIIFIISTFAILFAYQGLIKQIIDNNIVIIAIVLIVTNAVLSIGLTMYSRMDNNFMMNDENGFVNEIQNKIDKNKLGYETTKDIHIDPTAKIGGWIKTGISGVIFDLMGAALDLVKYLTYAAIFAAKAIFLPLTLYAVMVTNFGNIINPVVNALLGGFFAITTMIIYYQAIKYITNARGM